MPAGQQNLVRVPLNSRATILLLGQQMRFPFENEHFLPFLQHSSPHLGRPSGQAATHLPFVQT